MKNDALKKHHFWILLGVVPLFTLIGVLAVSSGVGGEIEAKEAAISAAQKDISSKLSPKPKELLVKADSLIDKVGKKRGDLHKDNWERQKDLFTWPSGSRLLKEIEQRNLKFGDPLPTDRGEFAEFQKREVYINEFSSLKRDGSGGPGTGMADRVAPTQFFGGWQNVLRHVNDFGQVNLTKDQVWLIMEDIWVQRSLLGAVRSVNEEMAVFHRAVVTPAGEVVDDPTYDDKGYKLVKDRAGNLTRTAIPESEKRKALFRNRTWAVELELVREGGAQRLTGTLTNLSERLQLMGMGNVMTLNVWFSHSPAEQPTPFHIGGEFLPGKGAMKGDKPANVLKVVQLDSHLLPAGKSAEEIVRVEQVFDIRTVPIKRIDALALGFRDSRNATAELKPPSSPPFAPEPTVEPGAGTDGGLGTGPGSAAGPPGGASIGPTPGGMPGVPMMPGTPGTPGAGGQGAQLSGGGPVTSVIDANKKRYLAVTDQVRRMPVGIVVVVDQSYMQDTLLAFANSPLRFQITQVTWTRFHGTLEGTGASGGVGNGSGVVGGQGNNYIPSYDDTGSSMYGGGKLGPVGGGSSLGPPAGGSSLGPPAGPGSSLGPPTGPGPVGPGPIGPGPIGGGAGGYGSPGGASSIASESQITSGLVELNIYGVVSLYEKFTTEPTPETGPDGAPADPNTPAPMPPMNQTPTTSNKRRRFRS